MTVIDPYSINKYHMMHSSHLSITNKCLIHCCEAFTHMNQTCSTQCYVHTPFGSDLDSIHLKPRRSVQLTFASFSQFSHGTSLPICPLAFPIYCLESKPHRTLYFPPWKLGNVSLKCLVFWPCSLQLVCVAI